MKLIVTRDSVEAADDMDAPHAISLEVDPRSSLEAVVNDHLGDYLPLIGGGKATWLLWQRLPAPRDGKTRHAGGPLAIVAQEWKHARWLSGWPPRANELAGEGTALHFEYRDQTDPQALTDTLAREAAVAKYRVPMGHHRWAVATAAEVEAILDGHIACPNGPPKLAAVVLYALDYAEEEVDLAGLFQVFDFVDRTVPSGAEIGWTLVYLRDAGLVTAGSGRFGLTKEGRQKMLHHGRGIEAARHVLGLVFS